MNCYYHPTRPAVAQCPDCGKGLCKECASKYENPICPECNNKRGQENLKTYLTPLIVCIVLFIIGCFVGKSLGDSPLPMGYIFTCIYGGWRIVGMFFSNIFVSLNLNSLLFYYGVKIILAMLVGIVATPVFLGYCIYKLIKLAKR